MYTADDARRNIATTVIHKYFSIKACAVACCLPFKKGDDGLERFFTLCGIREELGWNIIYFLSNQDMNTCNEYIDYEANKGELGSKKRPKTP